MGTSTGPLSWLQLAVMLLAAMTSVIKCSALPTNQRTSFCQLHVLPKGYECEEHEVYSDDGYMLRLHRVVLRGNLEKSVWQWLEPKLKQKFKHRKPLPWMKPLPPTAPFLTPPPQQSPRASAPVFGNGAAPGSGEYGGMPSSSAPPSLGKPNFRGTPSYAPGSAQTPVGFGTGGPPPSGSSAYGSPYTSPTVSPGSFKNSPTTAQAPSRSGFGSQGSPSQSAPGGYGMSPSSSSPTPAGAKGPSQSPSGISSTSHSISPSSQSFGGAPSSYGASPSSYSNTGSAGGPSMSSSPGTSRGAPSSYGASPSSYSNPGSAGGPSMSSSPGTSGGAPSSYGASPSSYSNTGSAGGPSMSSSPGTSGGAPSSYGASPSSYSHPGSAGGPSSGSFPSTFGGSPSSSSFSPPGGSGTSSSVTFVSVPSASAAGISTFGRSSSTSTSKAPPSWSSDCPSSCGHHARNTLLDRDPVLLMHHELLNGGSWFQQVHSGNDTLLPFSLVEQGFDVWIGHERATLWSHEHRKFTTHDDRFWNWTWDQHVEYDLPKVLTYISSETNSKVHYVGFSLSAAVGVAAATNSSVASLMRSLTLIAPAIYRGRTASTHLQGWDQHYTHAKMSDDEGWRFRRQGAFNLPMEFHLDALPLTGPSSGLRFVISGPDCCLGPSVISFDNGWDGVTSYKNIEHIQQGISTNTFQRFDYGSAALNAAAYNGKTTPPTYEPKDIPADLPVLVVYGGQDYLTTPEGVLEFMALPQTRPQEVYLPHYAHFDLWLSVRRADDVYGPIEAFLRHEYGAAEPYS